MLAYRVHRPGLPDRGPFNWLPDVNRDLARHYGNLPTPHQEAWPLPTWDWHCCCASWEQLDLWFPAKARRHLGEYYVLTAFDVPAEYLEVLPKQAIMHLPAARPLYRLDLTTLAPIITLS